MKVYLWRTPIEVVDVYPPDEQLPADRPLPVTGDSTYIGADSLHLYLRGSRGGEYLIDYDGTVTALYQRETDTSETLEKTTEQGENNLCWQFGDGTTHQLQLMTHDTAP